MGRISEMISKRKNFILFALLKVLNMVLGLISNIYIVRKLSVNDYGIFSVILMLVGLITTFGFSWSSASIIFYGSKEKAKTGSINKTFWARNIIIFVSLIVTTVLFVIFKRQINDYVGVDRSVLILIWLYFSVAEDYLNMYFLAVKKQLLSSMLSITARILYILMVLIFPFDVETLIIISIMSHATVLFYIFGFNKKDIGKYEFDKKWFKEVLNFSLWQLFGFSGLYLINFGDTVVIKHFMTTEDVGIYNGAYKLFNSIASFSYIVSHYYAGSVTTYFANKNVEKIKQFFYKERLLIFGLSIVAHIIVMIFSKSIIVILYGERYAQSTGIFNILMLGSMFKYLTVFYNIYYNTTSQHKILQTVNILSAILNVALDVVFIQIFGLIGPAIATTTAIAVGFTISFLYCEKRIKNFG